MEVEGGHASGPKLVVRTGPQQLFSRIIVLTSSFGHHHLPDASKSSAMGKKVPPPPLPGQQSLFGFFKRSDSSSTPVRPAPAPLKRTSSAPSTEPIPVLASSDVEDAAATSSFTKSTPTSALTSEAPMQLDAPEDDDDEPVVSSQLKVTLLVSLDHAH
jgi:hypothetical protein